MGGPVRKGTGTQWRAWLGAGWILVGLLACGPLGQEPVAAGVQETPLSTPPIGRTIWLKALVTDRYVSADLSRAPYAPLVADRTALLGWEMFDVVDAGNGYIGLRAHATGLYVSADLSRGAYAPLVADRSALLGWEMFQWIDLGNGFIALRSLATGLYVSADLSRGAYAPLVADRAQALGWEHFSWGIVGGDEFDAAQAERALAFAREQLRKTVSRHPARDMYPKSTLADGTWGLIPATDMIGWTQGFFPGSLWFMYQDTRDASWRTWATEWIANLEIQKTNRQTHDLGFKFMPSYGKTWDLTQDAAAREVLLTAAGSLASRYNPTLGIIDCCDWNSDWDVPMVADTMVNLELLLWGAREGGPAAWRDMAVNHALKTRDDLVRGSPDGSTFHVVDYDGSTGAIRFRGTFQGAADDSTWTRGQAWVMYGFTMVYRYTRDERMLEAARRVSDYYLSRLPDDAIPNWDFDSGILMPDSSAAAAAASALLELSTYVDDPITQQRYRERAKRALATLSSPAYIAQGTSNLSTLLHGVGHLPAGKEVDVGLIYGDYYFIEALLRFKAQATSTWDSWFNWTDSVHDLGPGNTGRLQVEFDVTPLASPIDGVVGYADSSTLITNYSSLAMLVRLNPQGRFDARNGSEYSALNPVPYAAQQTYHVRMVANLPARTYSVWVTPPGGSEVLLAQDFAFRSDAPPTNDLGQVALRSGYVFREFMLRHHTVTRLP